MLAASAIIDITYFLRQSLLSAAPWIEALLRELVLNPQFPSRAIEGRVLSSLVSALMYMRPQDARLPYYAERLLVILDNELDVNQQVMTGTHLVHYYARVAGDLRACEQIAIRIRPLLSSPQITVLNKILWRTLSVTFPVIACQKKDAHETVLSALSLVTENNLHFMEFIVKFYVVTVYLSLDELANVKSILESVETSVNSLHPADLAWLYLEKTIFAIKQGDYAAAFAYGETAGLR